MSFFLPFSFLSSFVKLRERERERESIQLQYLGRMEGKMVLRLTSLLRRASSEISFLSWASGILWSSAWRHLLSLVQELYFASSPGVLGTVSTHYLTPTAVRKTAFFIPISADEKGASGFRVLANHLASFFFLHPVRQFVRTTISIHPSEVMEYRGLTYILISTFNGQAEELTYIPYSSF